MRILGLTFAVLAGCQTDTGFQQGTGEADEGSNGVIVVTPGYLNFGEVALTYASSLTMTVASTGEEALDIYNARLVANPGAAFTFEERDDVVLNPGDSVEWPVAAYITAEGQYLGSIRFESNDGTTPTLFVDTCVVSEGYAEPCPDEPPGDDTGGDDTGANDTGDTADSGA